MPVNTYPPQGNFQNISTGTIQFDLTMDASPVEGLFSFNADSGLLAYGLAGGDVILDIGGKEMLPRRAKNQTGSLIPRGTLVRIVGTSGVNLLVAPADPNSFSGQLVAGMTIQDIANNSTGYVARAGVVDGTDDEPINTNAYAANTPLWLENTGTWADVRPTPPRFGVFIGLVIVPHPTQGQIGLRLINAQRLIGLSDVYSAGTPNDGDVIKYVAANSRYEVTAP